jgi:hypothetical protein
MQGVDHMGVSDQSRVAWDWLDVHGDEGVSTSNEFV